MTKHRTPDIEAKLIEFVDEQIGAVEDQVMCDLDELRDAIDTEDPLIKVQTLTEGINKIRRTIRTYDQLRSELVEEL